MEEQTIAALLQRATTRLSAPVGSAARLEAEILLSHQLGKSRSHLYAWPEQTVPEPVRQDFEALLTRRCQGEPIAYLTGRREFWSLELLVTRDTLIPRPETELLVVQTLELLQPVKGAQLAELGTGSGAISAALASERPDWRIIATDLSPAALTVAETNFARLELHNIRCAQGFWCKALLQGGKFDAILSNPPYVAADDPHLLRDGLDWEPRQALVAGIDGLDAIREIIAASPAHLKPGGRLLLEHGYQQGGAVIDLLRQRGLRDCTTCKDLGGRDRVSWGVLPDPDNQPI